MAGFAAGLRLLKHLSIFASSSGTIALHAQQVGDRFARTSDALAEQEARRRSDRWRASLGCQTSRERYEGLPNRSKAKGLTGVSAPSIELRAGDRGSAVFEARPESDPSDRARAAPAFPPSSHPVVAEGDMHAGKYRLHGKLSPHADIARNRGLSGNMARPARLPAWPAFRSGSSVPRNFEVAAKQRLLGNSRQRRGDLFLFVRRRRAHVQHVDLDLWLLRGWGRPQAAVALPGLAAEDPETG